MSWPLPFVTLTTSADGRTAPAAEVVPQLLDLMQDTGDFEYGMWKPFEEMTPDEQHDQLSQMSYLALRANVRMMKMTQVVKERDAGGRQGIRK